MAKRYLTSPIVALVVALLIWGVLLFGSSYNLLKLPLVDLLEPNRSAFLAVVSSSALGALVYSLLLTRSTQLDETRAELRTGLFLGVTAIIGPVFVYQDFDLAIRVISAFATVFFGGVLIAILMFLGILRDIRPSNQLSQQRTQKPGDQQPAQPPQPDHKLHSLSLALSLPSLPQPGQKLVIETDGRRIIVTVHQVNQ